MGTGQSAHMPYAHAAGSSEFGNVRQARMTMCATSWLSSPLFNASFWARHRKEAVVLCSAWPLANGRAGARVLCPLWLSRRFHMITWCYPDLMDKDEWKEDFAEPIMQGERGMTSWFSYCDHAF